LHKRVLSKFYTHGGYRKKPWELREKEPEG